GTDGINAPSAEDRRRWRAALGLPPDHVVVGGAGTLDWRKGPEIFVQLAATVHKLAPDLPISFCWVGNGSRRVVQRLRHDARHSGCDGSVVFTGERTDTPACFAAFDVLALTSREDPFPLVVLE